MLQKEKVITKVIGWMYLLREGETIGEGEWVQWQAVPRGDVKGKPLTGDADDINEIINEALQLLDAQNSDFLS